MAVLGPNDCNLRLIRSSFHINVVARDGLLLLEGEDANVEQAARVVQSLRDQAGHSDRILISEVEDLIDMAQRGIGSDRGNGIEVFRRDITIVPRTTGQEQYVQAVHGNDIVFAIGPAGTGKTYLAVAKAVSELKQGLYRRIVLARPAVEAGEKLGFLPGDPAEKINPYLRPLYDALNEMIDYEQMRRFVERDTIEVAPLAFMRGRTLNRAFVILDEAQNTTRTQMKMFLTRLGVRSKAVITGDITQIDLPRGEVSGLIHARDLLSNLPGIAFCHLSRHDIVRHPLVQHIVDAYEAEDRRENERASET